MNGEVYRHLLATYGRKPGYWFALTADALRTILNRIVGVVVLGSIVAAASAGEYNQARNLVLIWAGLAVLSSILVSAGELVGFRTESRLYGKLAVKYYEKLTNKDMSFYRDSRTGYLAAIFRQYLDSGLELIRLIRTDMSRTAISLVFPALVVMTQSWIVGAAMVLLVLSQATYLVWASKKANKYRLASHLVVREISGEVSDDVTNIVAYKSAGKEKQAKRRIQDLMKREVDTFWKRRTTVVYLNFPRDILTAVLVALTLWAALNGGATTTNSINLLVVTIIYLFQVLRSVGELPQLIIRHDDLITKMWPTLEILNNKQENIKDLDDPESFQPKSGRLEIKNLTFTYDKKQNKKPVIANFNLNIDKGEKVGIVGLSGAGKSTLANLIMRFDDIQDGQILFDGIDIREVPQSKLRQNIAYVPQEPILFHRSIKENIAYHNHKATEQEIKKAAKAAHAHEFIKDLPSGYDTIVGERGVKLSGGQKQRVVIARAVLKKAPVILFDEATSALDSESEHIVQKALPEIIGNHTAIIIAHRLSTIAGLDRIIVMQSGEIIEAGTHEQLLRQKGKYYSLWQRQVSNSDD